MRRGCAYIVIMLLLLLGGTNIAMGQSRNSLIITEDHLILKIDLQSQKTQIDSILKIAGVNGSNAEKILKHDFLALNEDGWNLEENSDNLVQFYRSLADINDNPQSRPFQITTTIGQIKGKPGYPDKVNYGVNKYKIATVYELASGLTRFILPGYLKTNRVFLAGSFNSWSTLKGAMVKTDGGWMIDVKLEPGAYEYKYIVGGRWMTDPNNLIHIDDESGNLNSIYYKYNHTFKLQGHENAGKVYVAGDFNEWKPDEIPLEKKGGGWQCQMYLNDGTHLYRFYVDVNEVIDPLNPIKEKDESGVLSSVIKLGELFNFKLNGYANAKRVFVAGDFNGWKPEDLLMKKTGAGWELPLVLAPGNYNYKFVADGQWLTDPINRRYAEEKGQTNSFVSIRPNRTFRLKGHERAKRVVLAGNFDEQGDHIYTMARDGDGWSISFNLKPGKYLYRFVVDGREMLDPTNALWEPADSEVGNSVLWIE